MILLKTKPSLKFYLVVYQIILIEQRLDLVELIGLNVILRLFGFGDSLALVTGYCASWFHSARTSTRHG